MNEPLTVTVMGNVAQEVRHVTTEQGVPITTFRLASTRRQYDRAAGRWVDGETAYVNVSCWRALADHVQASVSKGDPLVVIGRLRIRPWEREGYKGKSVEIEAFTVGHDLNRGTSAFRRAEARTSVTAPEREVADDLLMSLETGAQRSAYATAEAAAQAAGQTGETGSDPAVSSPGDLSDARRSAAA